ncbi:MAG: glycoside hydrolase family 5 protein [Clostridia bacterium]|nr:glycoside hydrolase family 5 protein [Clostridia bacterium]
MKKTISLFLMAALLLAVFAGFAVAPAAASGEDEAAPQVYDDGRARPSSCGKLQVVDGKLCGEDGLPAILRGVSTHDLIVTESFLNEKLFEELSRDAGVNVFRLAMYTHGVGVMGYCTGGDRERYEADIFKGVELARQQDMYAIIDWHILSDGDPNQYVDQAKDFFARMAEKYKDYSNVLYEICNEPNGVDWPTVKRYADEVIPVIREKDPKALIIVGDPQWSSDLKSVLADPLDFENILYTLHFYAASHGEDSRNAVAEASAQGLPIFVTEYGVTAANGGFPRDLESADLWIELLERERISYCMWTFSKVAEPCSAVRSTVPKYSGFEPSDYTATGLWLLETLAKHTSR